VTQRTVYRCDHCGLEFDQSESRQHFSLLKIEVGGLIGWERTTEKESIDFCSLRCVEAWVFKEKSK
jgi:hypothetical protein